MTTRTAVFALIVGLAAISATAQEPAPAAPEAAAPPKPATLGLFVYPGSGQDAAQQGKDENECYGWARQQTGIDPTAPAAAAATPEVPKGGTVKGAAGGAVVGTAIGAIAGDTGEGAAIGAVAGAAGDAARRRRRRSRRSSRRSRPPRPPPPRRRKRSRRPGRLSRGTRLQRQVKGRVIRQARRRREQGTKP